MQRKFCQQKFMYQTFGKVGWLGVYGWINFGEKSWYLGSVQNPGWSIIQPNYMGL